MAGILPASVRGHLSAKGQGAKGGVRDRGGGEIFGLQSAVEPAVLGGFYAGRAGLHVVLRVEVGAGHVGRAGGMDDGEMALVIEGLEGRKRGMEAEEAIEVENLVLRNGDAGTHGVVVLFAIGDDDIETVGGAALEDDDETAIGRCCCVLAENGADQKAGDCRGAGDGKRAFAEKESAVDGVHRVSPVSSGVEIPGSRATVRRALVLSFNC